MQQVISTQDIRTISQTYTRKENAVTRFLNWCTNQEKNRYLWLGVALMGGIATIVPITLICVVFLANNNFALWAITCSVNVPILIINLAAQPTKYTLPVMFTAWFIDVLIIATSALMFFGVI